MNILFVCKTLPHEKVIGGPVIIYNRIRLLSRSHTVSLLTFCSEEERPHVESVARYCRECEIVPFPPPRGFANQARDFFFSPVPNYFLNNYHPAMYQRLREMVKRHPYDAVISEYSMVAQYLYHNPDLAGTKRVMSVHECYYLARKKALQVQGLFSREGISALFYLKGLKRFEFDAYADADKVLVLTPQGRDELAAVRAGLNISVVPHGVDIEQFCEPAECVKEEAVMFLGNYPHDPNRDAVVWFHEHVWPLVLREVPAAKFYAVGKDPTPDMQELARRDPSVIVTGTVEDVRPYFERSKVFVCPVRIGGGFRGKVLEAMAMGLPIVSTALGAEGVPASSGDQMFIENDPTAFASRVVELLRDEDLCARVGRQARLMVEESFSWEKGVEELEKVLAEVVSE
jgi:glycosyltransferase involved in cell wall biosynthesis